MKKPEIDVSEQGSKAINDKIVGAIGESAAQAHLKKIGYKILARNVVLSAGELDIVATENDVIVFVEVKTRMKQDRYRPSDNVTHAKAARIKKLSSVWLARNKKYAKAKARYDVLEVILDKTTFAATEITVLKDYFC